MYLLVIHTPIYRDRDRALVQTDWKRSLELLRDSLRGRFGPIAVVAPSLPLSETSEQLLEPCSEGADGIRLMPSIDKRCRAREFWLRHRARWVSDVHTAAQTSQIAHCHFDDPMKPVAGLGMLVCVRANVPTIFVEDTDTALQIRQLARGGAPNAWLAAHTRALLEEQAVRLCVKNADLSLLKGRTLMEHYAKHSPYVHCFHDTSHRAHEVVSASVMEGRLEQLKTRKTVRLVYCGRIVQRKGLHEAVQLVRRVNALAQARVCELDIIGSGPDSERIGRLIDQEGQAPAVRMLGPFPYGPELLARLSSYDGMLFTPTAEDTPRMIFDGYAAALPLFGFDIEYVKERSDEDRATVLLDRTDPDRAAATLLSACRDQPRLRALSQAAREAGEYHASDRWYERRAQWTFEMFDRVQREGTRGGAQRGARA